MLHKISLSFAAHKRPFYQLVRIRNTHEKSESKSVRENVRGRIKREIE
jgi:hypothetical protein